jgi:hypothetical protein
VHAPRSHASAATEALSTGEGLTVPQRQELGAQHQANFEYEQGAVEPSDSYTHYLGPNVRTPQTSFAASYLGAPGRAEGGHSLLEYGLFNPERPDLLESYDAELNGVWMAAYMFSGTNQDFNVCLRQPLTNVRPSYDPYSDGDPRREAWMDSMIQAQTMTGGPATGGGRPQQRRSRDDTNYYNTEGDPRDGLYTVAICFACGRRPTRSAGERCRSCSTVHR